MQIIFLPHEVQELAQLLQSEEFEQPEVMIELVDQMLVQIVIQAGFDYQHYPLSHQFHFLVRLVHLTANIKNNHLAAVKSCLYKRIDVFLSSNPIHTSCMPSYIHSLIMSLISDGNFFTWKNL